jgi:anaerobic nitric oxide reductase transcription regulator
VVVELGHLDLAEARPGSDAAPPTPTEPAALGGGRPLGELVRDFQRRLVADAVERNRGNWAAAARELGLHRGNLHHLARRLGLR